VVGALVVVGADPVGCPMGRCMMPAGMVLGSLCSGAGGLDLAVAAHLPVEHAWHAEVDQVASTVLAAHWPDVPNLGDITTVDWARVAPVDVLTAGFPCQPFSAAGRRAGAQDERHLWPTGVLPAITALRPPLVVLENVPGLLTIQGGGVFGRVLADLDMLGYTVAWTMIGACKVGACHHRHRVFIAATLADVPSPDGALFGLPLAAAGKWPPAGFVRGGLVWEMPADTCGANGAVVLPTPRAIDGTSGRQTLIGGRTAGDRGPRLSDIGTLLPTPTARDATRGAGWGDQSGRPLSEVAALLPTPTAADGRSGSGHAATAQGAPDLRTTVTLLPTPRASDAAKGGPNQRGSSGDLMLPSAVRPDRWGMYAPAVHRHEQTYGALAPDPTEPGRLGKPRLAAPFVEWMMGLPSGWITGHVGRSAAIRCAGNGVVWQQAAVALRSLPTVRAVT
jgi:DNA (cytosine-5)-methyltransferase 1